MADQMTTSSTLVYELSDRFQEAGWLKDKREAAWHAFETMPVVRIEKTDLTRRKLNFGPFGQNAGSLPSSAAKFLEATDLPYVLLVDGIVEQVRIPDGVTLPEGVVFTDIHTGLNQIEAAKKHFGTVVKETEAPWTAANMALFQGGAFVYVPRNVTVDVPLQIVHVSTGQQKGEFPRSLIVAEDLANVSILEVHFSETPVPDTMVSQVVEIVAGQNTQVTFSAVDEFVKGPTHFVTRRAEQQKDSHVTWYVADAGNGFTVQLLESMLVGQGSTSEARVLGLGFERHHMDFTCSMVHAGKNTESDITMHGVLRDKANSVYRSRTQIIKGAVGAGSEQHDRMIMVDGTARADAIPMLLIDENDVKRCGHAASVGKIDPIQIYYLLSRGILYSVAMRMIIWGYLQETVDSIPSEAARTVLTERLEKELSR